MAFRGRELFDGQTIGFYNIDKGDIVDLVSPASLTIPISVRTVDGKRIPLEVSDNDTIQSVKQQIEEKEGLYCNVFLFFCVYIYKKIRDTCSSTGFIIQGKTTCE
jgi:hypothetical protein